MTPEEKDLINQIRSEDMELKSREKALKRLGEILEESYIPDSDSSLRENRELKNRAFQPEAEGQGIDPGI